MRKQLPSAKETVTVVAARPTADQYLHLRQQAGWDPVTLEAARRGLAESIFSLLAVDDNQVIGCARIVGDGALYFYVQDMLVDRDYRGRGIGTRLMQELLVWLRRHAGEGAFIGLMAAKDAPDFYRRFGFEDRPEGRPGMQLHAGALHDGSESSPEK